MKVLDVKSVQSGIEQTITDIKGVRSQIEPIQRAVRDFHSLEEDLKGQGGSAIRSFYQDTHEPFLIFLHQSLTDYENLLNEMKDAIDTYESNDSGYVSQSYLENDVIEGFDKVESQVSELTSDANSIIGEVDDIVTIEAFDHSKVMDDIQDGKEKAKDIVEELNILDEFEASQLEQTKDDVQTLRTFLNDMESKFKSGDLSIANYNAKSIQDLDSYNTIYDDIYNQEAESTTSITQDNIDEMPMYEIEQEKDAELAQLSQNGKDVLAMAYNDLDEGVIDRQSYLNILNDLRTYDNMDQVNNEEVSFSGDFLTYINRANTSASESASANEMPSMIYQNDDTNDGYMVTGEQEEVSDFFDVAGGVGYYETDYADLSGEDSGGKVGGKSTASLIHTEMNLDTDAASGYLHSDVAKGTITTQIGGESLLGLNIPAPLLKGEVTGYELSTGMYFGESERFGGELTGKTGNAKAFVGVDEQAFGAGAKASLVEGEGSFSIPIPFTDHEISIIGGASGGSIGGEAKIGRETMIDLRFGLGLKAGIRFD